MQIASQVREYLKRGVIQNAVNMPSIDHQQYTQMQPYIALAEKLGAFLANVVPASGSIQEISIRYTGRIADWNTELIRNAAIQGVLNQRDCRAGQRGQRGWPLPRNAAYRCMKARRLARSQRERRGRNFCAAKNDAG